MKEVVKIVFLKNVAKSRLEEGRARGSGATAKHDFFLAFRDSKYFAAWLISMLAEILYITVNKWFVLNVYSIFFCDFAQIRRNWFTQKFHVLQYSIVNEASAFIGPFTTLKRNSCC